MSSKALLESARHVIMALPKSDQLKIQQCAADLRLIIQAHSMWGQCAVWLVGLEVSAQQEEDLIQQMIKHRQN